MAVSTNPLVTGVPPFTYTASSITIPSGSQLLAPDGTAAAPSYSFSSSGNQDVGMFLAASDRIDFVTGGGSRVRLDGQSGGIRTRSDWFIAWESGAIGAGTDTILVRDAANTLALKNSTTAQTFRVYGTTTGPKYASLSHDGTDAILEAQSGVLFVKTGGFNRWSVNSSGNIVAVSGNSYKIGTIGATDGPSEIHVGTQVVTPVVTGTSIRLGESGGSVGFYGTTPVALQTGVAVSAAGIHAALVNLGLITA